MVKFQIGNTKNRRGHEEINKGKTNSELEFGLSIAPPIHCAQEKLAISANCAMEKKAPKNEQ